MLLANRPDPACDHHRLVVAPRLLRFYVVFEGAEVASQRWSAIFVVVGRRAYGPLQHDLQGRCQMPWKAGRIAIGRGFPRLSLARDAQVRGGEPGKACLGLGTPAHAPLVADLPTRARRRARKGRDGCGVVVRLRLHEDVRGPFPISV